MKPVKPEAFLLEPTRENRGRFLFFAGARRAEAWREGRHSGDVSPGDTFMAPAGGPENSGTGRSGRGYGFAPAQSSQ